jgi:hypothetical protein
MITRDDLSDVMKKAYDALTSEEGKEEFLVQHESVRNQAMRGAIARIQTRNNSHNVGRHIVKNK